MKVSVQLESVDVSNGCECCRADWTIGDAERGDNKEEVIKDEEEEEDGTWVRSCASVSGRLNRNEAMVFILCVMMPCERAASSCSTSNGDDESTS